MGDRLVALELNGVESRSTAAIARCPCPSHGVDGVDAPVDEELEEAELTVGEPQLKERWVLEDEPAPQGVVPSRHRGVALLFG